jgi:hypothetical protein
MTQYTDLIKLQALKNEIDKWSQKIKSHYMHTMYGDGYYQIIFNDDSREVMYNDGSVERTESPHDFEQLVRLYEQDHGEQW